MTVAQQVSTRQAAAGPRAGPVPGWAALLVCAAWLASVLLLDGAPGWLARTWLIGSGWAVVALLGRRRSVEQRWQCAAVMVYAALIELVFSAWLHTYVYRMGLVAPYVLPGHGVIFLTALALSGEPVLVRHRRLVAVGTAVAGLPLAVAGLLAGRHDQLGAAWAVCFVWFALRGRRPLLYAATFWIALGLEQGGVAVGAWTWAAHDPILGVLTVGNPPSVPGGGYVWLDAAGLWLGALIATRRGRRA